MTILRRIYLFSFLDDFMVIYPLYAVMFADSGLSTIQISILFIVWSVVGLLLEVPTGVLADKYDRRVILAVGEVIRAGGYLCWLLFPGFEGFLAGFVLWAVNGAFTSGTLEALVFDELKANDDEAQYVRVSGRCHALSMSAYLVASLFAAPIAHLGYALPLILSIAVCLVTAFVPLTFPRAARSMQVAELDKLSILRTGLQDVRRSRVLLGAIAFAALAGSFYGSLDEYSTLFVSDVGVQNGGVAFAATIFASVAAFASLLAHRASIHGRAVNSLILVMAGVALVLAAYLQSVVAIALVALFFFLTQLVTVVADAEVQHAISHGESRATITSVANLSTELAGLLVFVLFGLAGAQSRFVAFAACGVVLVVFAFGFLLRAGGVRQRSQSLSMESKRKGLDP